MFPHKAIMNGLTKAMGLWQGFAPGSEKDVGRMATFAPMLR